MNSNNLKLRFLLIHKFNVDSMKLDLNIWRDANIMLQLSTLKKRYKRQLEVGV